MKILNRSLILAAFVAVPMASAFAPSLGVNTAVCVLDEEDEINNGAWVDRICRFS